MRFQKVSEHLLQFEAVRGACSREWQVSDSLVMCAELDLAGYAGPATSPEASTRRRGAPSFLRISFVRFWPEGNGYSWIDGCLPAGNLSQAEEGVISTYQTIIHEWITDARSGLPPSTSSRLADRYRNKG
jgi:hypothetical protein